MFLDDRIFWIYFIISLFVIIVGLQFIFSSTDERKSFVIILWLISSLLLLIIVYYILLTLSPCNDNGMICFIDKESNLLSFSNKKWLLTNAIYIISLIVSLIWVTEFDTANSETLKIVTGIIMIIGGLLLNKLILSKFSMTFWISILYTLLWLLLTTYPIVIKSVYNT